MRLTGRVTIFVLCVSAGMLWAEVRSAPGPTFDPAAPAQAPIRLPDGSAPIQRIESATPALPMSVSVSGSIKPPALRLPGVDNPALELEVMRLRTAANRSAPARGQANAAWILGLLYLHGIGVPASQADAQSWFERAHALGEPLAPAGLAWCQIDACKTALNPAEARRWLNLLRPVNQPRAQYLQWLLEEKLSPLQLAAPSPLDRINAGAAPDRQLLLNAARAGDSQARIELAFESIAANRTAEALAYFQAASARSAVAAGNAALMTERMRTVNGTEPARPVAAGSDLLAEAQKNHRGYGRSANFVEAIRLYRLAQGKGSLEAKKMLELIFSRPGADGQIDIAWMQQLAYANVSQAVPSLDRTAARQTLRREPSPLFDLLPPFWRNQGNAN